jgi:hypothetical protein
VTVRHGRGHTEPDVVVLFAHDSTQLHEDAPDLFAPLTDATKVWIAYRKKGVSDLSRDVLMPALTGIGRRSSRRSLPHRDVDGDGRRPPA